LPDVRDLPAPYAAFFARPASTAPAVWLCLASGFPVARQIVRSAARTPRCCATLCHCNLTRASLSRRSVGSKPHWLHFPPSTPSLGASLETRKWNDTIATRTIKMDACTMMTWHFNQQHALERRNQADPGWQINVSCSPVTPAVDHPRFNSHMSGICPFSNRGMASRRNEAANGQGPLCVSTSSQST
jgi:hypothetical protein